MDSNLTNLAQLRETALRCKNLSAELAAAVAGAIEDVLGTAAKEFPAAELAVPAAGWTGAGPYEQVIPVEGVKAGMDNLALYPVNVADPKERAAYEAAVGCLAPAAESLDGQVKLTAYTLPARDFTVLLKGVWT